MKTIYLQMLIDKLRTHTINLSLLHEDIVKATTQGFDANSYTNVTYLNDELLRLQEEIDTLVTATIKGV